MTRVTIPTLLGTLSGSETRVTNELLKQGLCRSQLLVKGFLEDREHLTTLLCASNLAIIPSRTEDFGLTALEALSVGLPFLSVKTVDLEKPYKKFLVADHSL